MEPATERRELPLHSVWVTSAVASFVAAVYALTGRDAAVVSLFIGWAPAVSGVLWLQREARVREVRGVYEWGFLAFLLWPVVFPWYAFTSRGRAGWRLCLLLYAAVFAPLVAVFVALLFTVRW